MKQGVFITAICMVLIVPSLARAQTCGDFKIVPTKINIGLDLPKPEFNHDKTVEEINDAESDVRKLEWLKKNGLAGVHSAKDMVTQGYHQSGFSMLLYAKQAKLPYNKPGANHCLYFESVHFSLLFRAQIVIPKDFKYDGCAYNIIKRHELQHHQAMNDAANSVSKKLQAELPNIVAAAENRSYPSANSFAEKAKMMQIILQKKVIEYTQKEMVAELEERNHAIDSPEEYATTSQKKHACED